MKKKPIVIATLLGIISLSIHAIAGQSFSFVEDPFTFFGLEWGCSIEDVKDVLKEKDLYHPIACTFIGSDKYLAPDIHGAILDYPGVHYFVFDDDGLLIGGYSEVDLDWSDVDECYSAHQEIYGDCVEKYGEPQSSMMGVSVVPETKDEFFNVLEDKAFGFDCSWCAEDLSMLMYFVSEYDEKVTYKLYYTPHIEE